MVTGEDHGSGIPSYETHARWAAPCPDKTLEFKATGGNFWARGCSSSHCPTPPWGSISCPHPPSLRPAQLLSQVRMGGQRGGHSASRMHQDGPHSGTSCFSASSRHSAEHATLHVQGSAGPSATPTSGWDTRQRPIISTYFFSICEHVCLQQILNTDWHYTNTPFLMQESTFCKTLCVHQEALLTPMLPQALREDDRLVCHL